MIDWSSKNIDLTNAIHCGEGCVKTFCPECHEKRKASHRRERELFCVLNTGWFHCYNCEWQGFATVTTPEEKEAWMRQQSWYKDYRQKKSSQPPREYKKPKSPKTTGLTEGVIKWFKEKRGISEETLVKMGVTASRDHIPDFVDERPNKDGKGYWNDVIHFNYKKDGEIVNIKFRGPRKELWLVGGCERIAYNLDGIKDTEDCYIVEGEIDALALAEIGYTNVVSVPTGASDSTMSWLIDYYEEYFAMKKVVYICADLDKAGDTLRQNLVKHFDPAQYVLILDYGTDPKTGEKIKDADDCLVKLGPEALRKYLANGKTTRPEGDVDMDTVADEMDDIIRHGLPKGLPVGLPNLDSLLRIQKGRLYILTGTPGSGKSQFLDHVAVLMNARYGWKFSVYSPEMMPLGEHLTMFLTKYLGKPVSDIDPDSAEYADARLKVKEAVHFIDPDSNEIDDVLAIAKYQCRKYGCEAIIIDPWNSLLHHGESLFKVDNINEALLKILNFAHRQDVCAFVMPHPTNQQTTKDGKPMKIHLYNISGGAMFRNRGDFGMVMTRHYKDDDDNTFGFDYVEMAIEKTKWEYIAQLGTIYFRYEPGVGRFHPFDPATGETQWMQQSYLVPTQQPLTLPTAAPAAQPSEANVQAFLEQARRQEQALQPRPEANDLPVDNDNDIFDDNEEVPY